MVRDMKRVSGVSELLWFCGAVVLLTAARPLSAEPGAAAVAGFGAYTRGVESRLARQHAGAAGFVAAAPGESAAALAARLRGGGFAIERLTPGPGEVVAGGLVHHWRATAFAPGATAEDFERLLRDFGAYPRNFAPEVVQTRVLAESGDHAATLMRVRQKHGITVVMDTAYDVMFARLDAGHRYSISRSTRIAEIAGAGTPGEHALGPGDEHGFLWRLNTYWTYEECAGGLLLQVEAVSLTRDVPAGMGWAVRPFLESIPRESLEFTLGAAVRALRR